MTLPTGQISLSQVNTELDISPSSTTINMGATAVRTLADAPSGAIAMSDLQGKSNAQFIQATGGTIATQGNFKVHTFNSSGTFTVQGVGNDAGSNTVEYLVLAGGGSGGPGYGGGGGAGGYRTNFPSPSSGGLPVSAQGYPVTVGAGASGLGNNPFGPYSVQGPDGSNSVFSSITSTGGGGGGGVGPSSVGPGRTGGSGGGGGVSGNNPTGGGSGNNPPVSPPQGNNGGTSHGPPGGGGGGGGGANQAGGNAIPIPSPNPQAGDGGNGSPNSITGSDVTYGGGGGGGFFPNDPKAGSGGSGGGGNGGYAGGNSPNDGVAGQAGTANLGGGSGGTGGTKGGSAAGGSGKVVIRYQFQS